MRRPFPQSATRIERGCIVSGPHGLRIVLRRMKSRIVVVPVKKRIAWHHRADVHPSLFEALSIGITDRHTIRCIPAIVKARSFHPTNFLAPPALMGRIERAAQREMEAQGIEAGTNLRVWRYG